MYRHTSLTSQYKLPKTNLPVNNRYSPTILHQEISPMVRNRHVIVQKSEAPISPRWTPFPYLAARRSQHADKRREHVSVQRIAHKPCTNESNQKHNHFEKRKKKVLRG